MPHVAWQVSLWDINQDGLSEAKKAFRALRKLGIDIKLSVRAGDSFRIANLYQEKFDIVVTNPPWEMIKPDRRELAELEADAKTKYVALLKEFDAYLATQYPLSQPARKFAGWGTDLSRVGLELCHNICKSEGQIGIVLPASFFADAQSQKLRSTILSSGELVDIRSFPAEARLFGGADVSACTLLYRKRARSDQEPLVTRYDKKLRVSSSNKLKISCDRLQEHGYSLPVRIGAEATTLFYKLADKFPEWHKLEGKDPSGLWAGREIDETGSKGWLRPKGSGLKFIKGRMINRFAVVEQPSQYISKDKWVPPPSVNYARIAWRDVSRPSQKRRMIAAMIPSGVAAGNSLGVAYFKDGSRSALDALLGVMNSLCFEFQLRCHLATGHVSLSSVRKVRIPTKAELLKAEGLQQEVGKILRGKVSSHELVEALVAKHIYGLSFDEFEIIIDTFEKITEEEKKSLLQEYKDIKDRYSEVSCDESHAGSSVEISNHFSARLSELDMSIVRCVQPGGNWKQIPTSIPSKRVETIRQSYARGEGSRSTYYGRLRKDRPSYTINTYFSRPGNGCHIHYSQIVCYPNERLVGCSLFQIVSGLLVHRET